MLQSAFFHSDAGFLFTKINQMIQNHRAVSGAAFPSSYVAGALVWMLSTLRWEKKLGYLMLPIAAGIIPASVYLGLHDAINPLFGIIWGFVCYFTGVAILKKRGEIS
ncbi:MAG: hypothetical protein JXB26_11735 [Candidatus Aminicenantes bacterium]|nr:hypothetical protein [Candidatus Aminicenantes bacterium]